MTGNLKEMQSLHFSNKTNNRKAPQINASFKMRKAVALHGSYQTLE
jgi:hypothetical protein